MIGDYSIYFPPGYKESETDFTVDISEVWDKKLSAIKAHVSQQKNVEKIVEILSTLPKKEYFLLRKW